MKPLFIDDCCNKKRNSVVEDLKLFVRIGYYATL